MAVKPISSLPPPPGQPGVDPAHLYVWVKGLETKVNNLLREVDLIKNDFIKKSNNYRKEIKSLSEELLEVKHAQEKTSQKMELMIKELKRTAGLEEVETLKKYIEFWNPLTFVTQKDLQRALESRKETNNLSEKDKNKDVFIPENKEK